MLKVLEPFVMLSLTIALGVFVYAIKLIDLDFCRKLSRLVVRVTFPAMLFISMYKNVDQQSLKQGWIFIVLGLTTSIILAFTAHYSGGLLGLKGKTSGTYQILCTNGNNVFLPVPIITVLFGLEYVVYAVLFELGAGFFYWSYGVSHFRSGPKFDLKRLFNQNMIALVLGLGFSFFEIRLPDVLVGGLEIVGNITLGSAMLIIGALVANLLEQRLSLRREVWGVLVHRFLLSPLVGVIFLQFADLPGELRTILLIMSAMPPLVTTALVAASMGGDEELAAQGVVIPTLLSFIVIPLALLFI
ncbi:MAG: AEC family transporter [Firmicutes bacterium]|nr:AEC family transporter [Bacillota bacterium]